ncbi:MAG: ribonuclease P protein component [Halanaerobiaceae bacterium]|nr:ribonuclease P protein component [Halanaerobiaceae bacterium]
MLRLRKKSEFNRVYNRGKSVATYNLVLYYYPNNQNLNRVGFSISKKIGKAVVRNKLKRRLREIIRLKKDLKKGFDIIIIARKPVIELDYCGLERDLDILLSKAGIKEEIRGK